MGEWNPDLTTREGTEKSTDRTNKRTTTKAGGREEEAGRVKGWTSGGDRPRCYPIRSDRDGEGAGGNGDR